MTVDVLAMGAVSFLVGVLYADRKVEIAAGRLQHEINNLHVRLNGLENKIPTPAPDDYEDPTL